jgi:MFS transporter, DHA2 family, multidrug resistance protein
LPKLPTVSGDPRAMAQDSAAGYPTIGLQQKRGLLLGLGLATGMEFFTFEAVNLVLLDLAGTLGVSLDQASWLLTIYSSTLFLGVPVCIWLARQVGYKRYLMGTTLLFAAASTGCMLAPDLYTMLVWRAIQGFAGAGLYVWWRAAIYMLLPKSERPGSMMRVSCMLFLSSAAGLLLGGSLTDLFGWRLIFMPAIPYAGAALWLLSRYFPTLQPYASDRPADTDWPGIAMLAISLVSLQVVLNRGPIDDWLASPEIRLLGWIAVSAFIAFVWWQTSPRNRVPLLCFELLRDRRVVSAALIGVFTGMILSGSLFVLPEFLRNTAVPALSAAQTGEVMCTYALSAALIRVAALKVIPRIGQRKMIMVAILALIASMLILSRSLTTRTPTIDYVLPLVLYACCISTLLPAVGSGTVAKIEQHKLLDGVSLYMTFRQFGAALGVSLLTALLERRQSLHSSRLFEHLQAAGGTTFQWLEQAAGLAVRRGGLSTHDGGSVAVMLLQRVGSRQADTLAIADAFLFMAFVGVLALCLVPIVPPTPPAR